MTAPMNPDSVERDDEFINGLASLPAEEQATVLFDFATDTRESVEEDGWAR